MKRICRELFKNTEQERVNRKSEVVIHNVEISNSPNSLNSMNVIKDWLQTYDSKSRNQKRHNLMTFLDWLDKSPEEVLKLRKQDQNRGFEKLCIKWVNYSIEEKDFEVSTAVSKLGTIRSWFQYHDMPLRFKRNELPKPRPKPRKFSLTIQHLRDMWSYLSVWMRACVIIGLENGLRISDVMALKKSDILNMLNQNVNYPSMEISTLKTGVLARIHLSPESQETIRVYLKTIPENQTKLFKKDVDTVAKMLQKSFRLAYLNIDFKPTFKCFRQIFLSTGSNLGVNEWHLRLMCGKQVPSDMLPYLRNLDLKSDFIKIKAELTVQTSLKAENHELLKGMQLTIANQQSELDDLKVRLEALGKEYKKIADALGVLVPKEWLDQLPD